MLAKTNKHQRANSHIRWMIRRDYAEVLAIEARGFEFPWCEDDFIRCLRQSASRIWPRSCFSARTVSAP
jgi:hypothetical protein